MAATIYYGECGTHGEGTKFRFCPDRRFRCIHCLDNCPPKEWPFKYVKPVEHATIRTTKVHLDGIKSDRPCNGKCTSGKTSCDCRCMGKCHGAGRCLGGHA
jgi:hypothetical protein